MEEGFDVSILSQFNNWFVFCGKDQLIDVLNAAQSNRWMLVTWNNWDTPDYDVSRVGGTYYNVPQDYTIETSTNGSTWVVVATVTGNVLTGRQHLINMYGKVSWRMSITAIPRSSITALALKTPNIGSPAITAASWGDQVFTLIGSHRPPSQCGGNSGWKTSNFLADDGTGRGMTVFENYLEHCPFKYVTLNIGSNDASRRRCTARSASSRRFVIRPTRSAITTSSS